MDTSALEFNGEADFRRHVVEACRQLAEVRAMDWVDAEFDRWPLSDADLLEALTRWGRLPGRRLRLLARSYDGLRTRHPRFVEWRRVFSHIVDARSPEEPDIDWPCQLLCDRSRAVVVHDRVRWRGETVLEPPRIVAMGRALEPVRERSVAAFAPSVLGL